MCRFLFDFDNFPNERSTSALLLALASYVLFLLALIVATGAFPDRATLWAVALLSLFTFWSVWTLRPIVRFLANRFRGPRQ